MIKSKNAIIAKNDFCDRQRKPMQTETNIHSTENRKSLSEVISKEHIKMIFPFCSLNTGGVIRLISLSTIIFCWNIWNDIFSYVDATLVMFSLSFFSIFKSKRSIDYIKQHQSRFSSITVGYCAIFAVIDSVWIVQIPNRMCVKSNAFRLHKWLMYFDWIEINIPPLVLVADV